MSERSTPDRQDDPHREDQPSCESTPPRSGQPDEETTQLLRALAHDMRTPLTSIKGMAENLRNDPSSTLTDRQRFYLERIVANVDSLTQIIERRCYPNKES